MMNRTLPTETKRHPLVTFLIFAVALVGAYYVVILFHEWAHGTTAWILGYKDNPFDVRYGGWLLMNCDEVVPYSTILNQGHGLHVALIGISGYVMNIVLFVLSLFSLSRIFVMRSLYLLAFFYLFCVLNLMALFGYVPLNAFSHYGDIGWFVRGLDISPWPTFIAGSLLVMTGIYRIFHVEIVKVYAFAPLCSLSARRSLLGISLFFLFLFLYTRGYNPFTDPGANPINQILAGFSILLAPVIFYICNPSRNWVLRAVRDCEKKKNF